jgi:HK97 family phage major capsid protein
MAKHSFADNEKPLRARPVADDIYGRTRPRSLEHELHQAIEREIGPPPHGGIYVPTRLRAAGLDTKSSGAGAYTVGADVLSITDVLLAESSVLRLGAVIVSGLRGNTSWPVELAAPTATWVAENSGGDVGEDDASFGVTPAVPKMLTSTTSYSRKLLVQASPQIDAWVKRRLGRAHASGIDAAAINGSAANSPTGLLHTANVGLVAMGANGGVITAQALIDLETTLSNANASASGLLTTPGIRAKLRTLPSITSGSVPVWNGDQVLSYRGEVSTNVPSDLVKGTSSLSSACHGVILGDFSNLLIAEWGVLEILVDPYRLKKQGGGQIEVTSYQTCDIAVIRPSAFVTCVDAKPS